MREVDGPGGPNSDPITTCYMVSKIIQGEKGGEDMAVAMLQVTCSKDT